MSDVQPALSREEWEEALNHPRGMWMLGDTVEISGEPGLEGICFLEPGTPEGPTIHTEKDRKVVAALCLVGYFTWEMVDRLRAWSQPTEAPGQGVEWMRDLADLIAALLPPLQASEE